MAEHKLGRINCVNNLALSYDKGDVLTIFWDDSDDSFRVSFFDFDAGTTSDISGGGFILRNEVDDGFYIIAEIGYQFCTGNDLTRFVIQSEFPYFKKNIVESSTICQTTSCDILIIGSPKVANSSDASAADGQIEVTASSSNQVRFTLDGRERYIELPAATDNGDGTYTYTFTGLRSGTYTVHAIDSEGCEARKSVFVDFDQIGNYGLYRWFDTISEDINPRRYRVEILKNNYDSSASEIRDTADSPIRISFRGENKGTFQQIIESEINIGLMNTSNFQFIDLFTQDDSEYLVKVIHNPLDASSVVHQGFIVPQLYSEPFIDPPYATFVKATDRLADLESFDFLDEVKDPIDSSIVITSPIRGRNSVLEIIMICLNKLGTGQGLRVAFNLYEDSHNSTATDDPLTQTFVNCDSYYDADGEPLNCREVLEEIIKPLGARLFSSQGYYYLCRIIELKETSVAYREFNRRGEFVTNSTINPVIDFKTAYESTRAVMGADLVLGIEELFGKINIIKNRDISDTLFPPFSAFTVEGDSFLGWTPTLNGDSGSVIAKEVIINTDKITERQIDKIRSSRSGSSSPIQTKTIETRKVIVRKTIEKQWALRFNIDDDGGGDAYASRKGSVEYNNQDSFQVVVNLQFNTSYRNKPPYVKAKWLFKVGNKYLLSTGSWSTTETINEFFITEYNKRSEYIITALFDEDASAVTTSSYEFRIYDISPLEIDSSGSTKNNMLTDIKTVSTSNLQSGDRLIARFPASGGRYQMSYWEFVENSTESASSIVLIPNDDSGARWFYVTELTLDPTGRGVSSSVDYLKISFNTFPSEISVDDEVIDTVSINTGNLRELDYELFHFDLDTTVNNIENIVRNYFQLSDGTPTGAWGSDSKKIQKILSDTISELIFPQGSESKRGAFRINGQFYIDVVHAFFNVFRDLSDNNRVYIVNGCTWDLKKRVLTGVEMVEIGSSLETKTKAYKDNSYSSGYS